MLAFAFIYTLHCADLCAVGTHSTKPEMLNDGCSVVFLTFLTWAFRRRKGSEKIQARQGLNKWRPDLEEEYEDQEGNIYNKKTYTDLQRQGLI